MSTKLTRKLMTMLNYNLAMNELDNLIEHLLVRAYCKARFGIIKSKSIKFLVEYHRKHKYLFMTYSPKKLKQMGNTVANHNSLPKKVVFKKYSDSLEQILENPPTKKNRVNTLYHIYGYFKYDLLKSDKSDYYDAHKAYLSGLVDFSYPISILERYAYKFNKEYLMDQYIFKYSKL